MILMHDRTRRLIDSALDSSAHAVLLTGPQGTGKKHAARYYAGRKLNASSDNHPYVRVVSPENGSISIDQIRALKKFLQLKTPGAELIRRAVIIQNAHLMTNEAQNSLLKILEEPPSDTVLVLTSPRTTQLRDTIYSRVRQIPVMPVDLGSAQKYFTNHDSAEIKKAHQMSAGHPGLMSALLEQKDHELVQQIQNIKQILAASTFHRLTLVDQMSKNKAQLPVFLQAAKLLSSAALQQTASQNSPAKTAQWTRRYGLFHDAQANLSRNANIKLLLTDLFLQI